MFMPIDGADYQRLFGFSEVEEVSISACEEYCAVMSDSDTD